MASPFTHHLTSPLGLLVALSVLLLLLNLATRQPSVNMTTPATTTTTTTTTPTTDPPILALNLCLIPPPSTTIHRLAHSLNQHMRALDSHSFIYSTTRYPHVTVVQCYINSTQLPALLHDLQSLLTSSANTAFTPLHLPAGDIAPGPVQDGRYVPSLAVPPTAQLTALHTQLLSLTLPYTLTTPPPNAQLQSAFYTDSTAPLIDSGTTDWVATFRINAANEHYFPHITLGTCSVASNGLDELVKRRQQALSSSDGQGGVGGEEWVADQLYVFQLGNSGTVRKKLAEIAFG